MRFSGWENVKPGEEFSIDEISAFYGILGPYHMLEKVSFTRWGRYPFMVRAVAKDGVENLFEPGEKVRVFMRPLPGEDGVRDYLATLGIKAGMMTPTSPAKHIFTHIEWHMIAYEVTVTAEFDGFRADGEMMLVDNATLREQYAIPSAFAAYKKKL